MSELEHKIEEGETIETPIEETEEAPQEEIVVEEVVETVETPTETTESTNEEPSEESSEEPSEEPTEEPTSIEVVEEVVEESQSETLVETDPTTVEATQPEGEAVLPLDTGRGAAILEGLLFIVGDDGLTIEQAASSLDINEERTKDLFDELMKKYSDDAYGIEIANYGGTYRFLSKAFVHDYAKKLFQMSKEATLSQAALETLAIIAYKQPITRVEIEEIRGVGADMMLRKLLARDLICECGRSEAPGRPILYGVTDEFMDSFKLLSLDELPELPKFNDENEESDLFKQ